jgi:osmotically-inducible protein OsmY
MNERQALLAGAGIGAGLMYVLDPERGRRRRALVRDRMTSVLGQAGDAFSVTARDMTNRTRGLFAETRNAVAPRAVPDAVLAERVRSELGHYSAHPGAIAVSASDGRVTLRGACLASEVERIARAVGRVRGVRRS